MLVLVPLLATCEISISEVTETRNNESVTIAIS